MEALRGDGIWKGLMTETGFILLYSFNWWQKVPTTTVKKETAREGIVVGMSTTEREARTPSRHSVDNLSSPPDAGAWWLWAEIHNFISLRAASLSIVESGQKKKSKKIHCYFFSRKYVSRKKRRESVTEVGLRHLTRKLFTPCLWHDHPGYLEEKRKSLEEARLKWSCCVCKARNRYIEGVIHTVDFLWRWP